MLGHPPLSAGDADPGDRVRDGHGHGAVLDFMPPRDQVSDLVRLVVGRSGRVRMRTDLALRFDYGSVVPWVSRDDDGALRAIAGPDMVVLRTTARLHGEGLRTVGEFDVAAGETVAFVLEYVPSHLPTAGADRRHGGTGRDREVSGRNGRAAARRRANGRMPCSAR